MGIKNEFNINFVSLKLGTHEFNFKIERSFFENFENSPVNDCTADVQLFFTKSENILVLSFDIKGIISSECDLCLSPLDIEVEGQFKQIIKFSEEKVESEDDEISFLSFSDYEVDISPYIYEFIVLLLPTKKVHKNEGCNNDIASILDEYLLTEEDESNSQEDVSKIDEKELDPRWSELLKLKKDK